jgi:hypothetical protein
MPFPQELLAVFFNHLAKLRKLVFPHTIIVRQRDRLQPKLARIFSAAHMDVRRLVTLVAVEVKAKSEPAEDRRHTWSLRVAVAVSLHGPFAPVGFTHRSR